jgi:hypothetical protein
VPHTLNFDQLQFGNDFVNDSIVAKANAVCALRPAQFFDPLRKRVFGKEFDSLDDFLLSTCGQFAQVLAREFLPLNAKGHGVSTLF